MDLKEKITKIKSLAKEIRKNILTMSLAAGASSSHFGGSLSTVEILATLYNNVLKFDASNPLWENRDRFILSKGHACLGYYSVLCEKGFFDKEDLRLFEKNESFLLGHPVINKKKGIEFSNGSLGMGLSLGIGVAIAAKKNKKNYKIFVLIGDGECNEGSIWEASMSAAHYKLNNLTAIVDNNNLQQTGSNDEIMLSRNLADKWRSFNWDVKEIDGHDISQILAAFNHVSEKPKLILAKTIKGKGFSFSENNNDWHHNIMTKKQHDDALKELDESNKILNKTNFKIWSRLGMRATFGIAALELANTVDKLIILTGDVSTSAGLDRFKKKFPDKYLDVGIAEQNLIGIGTGLASEGFNVITTTFAPFQTMRCCEQIKVNLGYMQQKLCMVGLASGLVLGTLGYTHCCIEDVGILRPIPNLTIISPADSGEAVKAVVAGLKHKNSVYIRLTGGANIEQIYDDDYDFSIGKSITLKNGKDISIFAAGTMVKVALDCSKILNQNNISAEVINMHTIKPIDGQKIIESAKSSKLIVSIEEHNVIGGLGSAIAECLANVKHSPKHIFFGINDTYSKGGEYSYLKEKFGLTPNAISEKIMLKLKEE